MDLHKRPILLGMTCFTLPCRGISINNQPLYRLTEYQRCMETMLSEVRGVIIATPEFAEQIRFQNPIIIVATEKPQVPLPKGTIQVTKTPEEALLFAKSKYANIWCFGGKEVHDPLFRNYDFIVTMELYEGNSVKKPTECFPDFISIFELKNVLSAGFIKERNVQYKVKRYEKIA
jgi:dihydrofolate reductase